MKASLRVLIADDSEDDAALLVRELRQAWDVSWIRVDTEVALEDALRAPGWDLVLSDYSMPGFSGMDVLRVLRRVAPDLPCILVSGTIGEETAVDAMRAGARDYLLKGNLQRLVPAVERELREVAETLRVRRDLERKDEMLRQAQKMEVVGRLTGGVAHDFNNMLTVISGYSDILLTQAGDGAARKPLEEINKAAHRAARVTGQLLAFSRQQVVQPKVVEINDVIQDMAKMLQRLLGEDVRMRTSLAREAGRLKIDVGQLEQVLMNLVVNARDAMPQGGVVEVRTSHATLPETRAVHGGTIPAGPYVRIEVADTGTGMPPEVKARIFEPFFTTKAVGKGTGLGLAVVLGVVQRSNGDVEVDSVPGRGTTFRIHLPAQEGDAGADEVEPAARAALRGSETILLVEDEPMIREMSQAILSEAGYAILPAANAGEALLLCERNAGPIHLLLTDVMMPHMRGPELASRARTLRSDLRVLYMSGSIAGQSLEAEQDDPAFCFIAKPFSRTALLGAVRDALSSEGVGPAASGVRDEEDGT